MLKDFINYDFNEEMGKLILGLNDNLIQVGDYFLNGYLDTKIYKEFTYIDSNINLYYDLNILKNIKSFILSDEYLTNRIIKLKLNEISDKNDRYYDLFKALVGAYLIDGIDTDYSYIEYLLDLDNGILLNIDSTKNYYKMVYDWSKHKYKEVFDLKCDKDNMYNTTIILKDIDILFSSSNKSKYLSYIEASKKAYEYLEKNKLLLKMKDIVGEADLQNYVNQLQDLYQKGFINEPIYKITLKGSSGGVDTWRCRVIVDGYKESFSFDDTSKKSCKRNAAYSMLKYILEQEK